MTSQTTVLFRTSGGMESGLGHVRRCLTLAAELARRGVVSRFLLDGDPDLCEFVKTEGFDANFENRFSGAEWTLRMCRELNASAVVIDSYQATRDFYERLRTSTPTVAIDDLGDRDLAVDLVVNGCAGAQNLEYQSARNALRGVPYVLLRREFREDPIREFQGSVARILVIVGGSDSHRLTASLLTWSADILPQVFFDVIVGPLFGDASSLEALVGRLAERTRLHRNPPWIRTLMLRSDLAISGGGQTLYELAATATPTIAVRIAPNQTANLQGLSRAGTLRWIGDWNDGDLRERLAEALLPLSNSQSERETLGETGRRLVDGRGAERVADAVIELVSERSRRP